MLMPNKILPAHQEPMFTDPSKDHTMQASYLPTVEHWRGMLRRYAEYDYSNPANAIGFIMEVAILAVLGRLAIVGGHVTHQHQIAIGTRADFFVSGLTTFPHGIAIEVRDHLSAGSHGKKLVDTAMTYDRLKVPMCLVTIGHKSIHHTSLKNLHAFCNSSQYVKHRSFDEFIEWVVWIQKKEQ